MLASSAWNKAGPGEAASLIPEDDSLLLQPQAGAPPCGLSVSPAEYQAALLALVVGFVVACVSARRRVHATRNRTSMPWGVGCPEARRATADAAAGDAPKPGELRGYRRRRGRRGGWRCPR